jgi:hypothetical protein
LASAVIGAGLNYWFIKAWGARAKAHFRQRHLLLRQQNLKPVIEGQLILPGSASK